jgi:uncharacterized pyridoxamine 5'-phosphate oxidase family protein
MKSILEFLEENPYGQLATIEGEQIKQRPFQFQLVNNRKLYFVTSKEKSVYQQILNNNEVSFCVLGKDMRWLRVNGSVVIEDSKLIKQQIFDKRKTIKDIYKSVENENLVLFYIYDYEISLHELKGSIIESSAYTGQNDNKY